MKEYYEKFAQIEDWNKHLVFVYCEALQQRPKPLIDLNYKRPNPKKDLSPQKT